VDALKRWFHRMGSPRWFYGIAGAWLPWLGAVAALLLTVGTVWGLMFAPPDYQQGNSFRIIYVHVPAAHLAEACYMLIAGAGAILLVWRIKLADMVMSAAAPIGAALTVLALASGAIWGRPTWGAWWVWDARTTSVLMLLFLYVGIIALRDAIPREENAARAAAVLALVGAVNIPIIKFSVEWWMTLHQPASLSLTEAPTMPPVMWVPLVINILGFYSLFLFAVFANTRAEILRRERRTEWVQALSRDAGEKADAV
jgi:heme exporter protein C